MRVLQLPYMYFIVTGIGFHVFPTSSGQEKSIGFFTSCAHGVKGEVFVKNEREVIIKGFHYDGNGPAAWFHAMRKGILGGVHAADESYYYTLPYPKNGDCNRIKGQPFNGEEITLILPVSIKKLGTIGLLCYRTCLNFGHINIPPDLSVPAAPTQLPETKPCPKPPEMERCVAKGGSGRETRRGGPNCEAGGPGPSPEKPSPPGPEPVLTTPRSGSSNTSEVPKKGMSSKTVLITLCVVFAVAVLTVAAIGFRVWSRRRHRVIATDANAAVASAVVVRQPDAL